MALEAQIVVALDEQLRVDRAVRMVANRAAFAQCLVLEHERTGLIAMALGARLVEPRHGQAGGGFENIGAVRVVALHAIHLAFDDGMMLWETEFRVRFQVAVETRGGVCAGIDDEPAAPAARGDVLAAGPMTGFTTALAGQGGSFAVNACMRTGGKDADIIGMTIVTRLIADVICARDFRRGKNRARNGGTGVNEQGGEEDGQREQTAIEPELHGTPPATHLLRRGHEPCRSRNRVKK